MSQLNLYLPQRLADDVRRRAKRQKVSVSKYVARILEKEAALGTSGWDEDFFSKVAGGWKGKLSREPALPVEERDPL